MPGSKRWLRPITGNGRIIHLFRPSHPPSHPPSAPTLITPHHSALVWQRRPWVRLLYAYQMISSVHFIIFSPDPPCAPNPNNPHPSSPYSAGMAKKALEAILMRGWNNHLPAQLHTVLLCPLARYSLILF